MPGELRRIVVLLAATAIGIAVLLPASGGAAALNTWRGTVLISAKYDKAGAFEGERDYFTYTAKAVFDGKGTRVTKRGTMTWSFDAGTRTGPDPQKSFPCTWQGAGTSPVTVEFYKAGEPGEPSNLAVRLFLQIPPKSGTVTERCWGWDGAEYSWLTKQADAWQAVRGTEGMSLALPVKTAAFKRTVRPWFPFLDNPRAARATVVAKFAVR